MPSLFGSASPSLPASLSLFCILPPSSAASAPASLHPWSIFLFPAWLSREAHFISCCNYLYPPSPSNLLLHPPPKEEGSTPVTVSVCRATGRGGRANQRRTCTLTRKHDEGSYPGVENCKILFFFPTSSKRLWSAASQTSPLP